jgi:NADH-quinone oxidoreductase subunit D
MDEIMVKVEMLTGAVLDDPVIHARLKVGPLSKKQAIDYSVVGPTARGAGLMIDVRLNEPYAAYDKIGYKIVTQMEGTVMAQAVVRLLELAHSIDLVKEMVAKMPAGPWCAEVGEVPEGEGIGRVEAPRGEAFHYIRSDGGNYPIRHKVRAPTYVNLPSVQAMIKNCKLGDFPLILASIDPCFCCTDRMVVLNTNIGRHRVKLDDLLMLSWEETERLRKKFGRATHVWPEL